MASRAPDFEYQPTVDDLDLSLAGLVAHRLLLLGGEPHVGHPAVEARHASLPGPVLPNGLYIFRTTDGVDAMWVIEGSAPGLPAVANHHETTDDHPLRRAQQWLESLWAQAVPLGAAARFGVGDWVSIAGDHAVGHVERVDPHDSTYTYRVRVDGLPRTVTEAGLLPLVLDADDPRSWLLTPPASARELSVSLTVTKLTNPLTDTIYSYLSSKTVFRPYQFRPVLRMIESPHQRLLIADEVGLGKTIEAGLVWTELEARNPQLNRVLVVCPAALITKWQVEMRTRFDRELRLLDTPGLHELAAILRSGDEDKPIFGVVSIERMRLSKALAELAELHPRFDLVIVDEAHYLRNRGTLSHELGQVLSDWSDALLFLSATPLNLGSDDLFNLVNLLVEDEFSDPAIFPLQIEPNRHLNAVAAGLLQHRDDPATLLPLLDAVATCRLGEAVTRRPEFAEVRALLAAGPLSWEAVSQARRLLGDLNTLSSVLTRTRKVDVPDAKATREAVQVDVAWSPEERAFYNGVLTWARRRALALGHVPGFATQMPLRQAASCLPAMRDLLRVKDPSLFARQPSNDDFDDVIVPTERGAGTDELTSWDEITTAIQGLGDQDTKFDRFVDLLKEKAEWSDSPVLVFSFFRRTIAYLESRLQGHWKVRSMHGGTPMADRQQLMEDFRAGEFDILIASEVASEGLDFEFCQAVVNYDLPWNPMRVEQRIGRLDRFGQRHEKIFVVNFHVPGTIETDIFERLYKRIKVFTESIGELEPILRDQVGELAKIALAPELSEAQRATRIGQVAVAIEARRHDLEDLQEAQSLLSGIDRLLIDGFERDTIDRGRFIGPSELRLLIEELCADGTRARLHLDGDPGHGELHGDAELAERVSRGSGSRGGSKMPTPRLVAALRDGEPLPVTFDNEEASRTSYDLISLRHPVVKAAVRWFARRPQGVKRFGSVKVAKLPPGQWLVVIYVASTTGLRPALELWPIAISTADSTLTGSVGDAVLAAAAKADLRDGPTVDPDALLAFVDLADRHLRDRQIAVEAERREANAALVDARIAAQRASCQSKVQRVRETLAKVRQAGRSASLERLHEGRIVNLQMRLNETVDEMEGRRHLAVTTHPVAVILAEGG